MYLLEVDRVANVLKYMGKKLQCHWEPTPFSSMVMDLWACAKTWMWSRTVDLNGQARGLEH
jgi:hypothetical protein